MKTIASEAMRSVMPIVVCEAPELCGVVRLMR
jgi:hypothetical protein